MSQVPVGDLFCQRDSYAKELETTCISCSDKPDKKGFYQVHLKDTVLFPEGGGQPADTGSINGVQVYDVQRHKLAHVHYTKERVEPGPVHVTLDWSRRRDHMQQHSGQHLLSAVLEQEPYKMETVGWALKDKFAYIELGTAGGKAPTQAQLDEVEGVVNAWIRQATPMVCHTTAHDEKNGLSSLPADYAGDGGVIRTIEIEGLDRNPCCGTHVKHLGDLQVLKLLHTENIRGGNTRVYFVFGDRVTDTLHNLYDVSRQLNKALSVPVDQLVESVTRLQLATRNQAKIIKQWQARSAAHACDRIAKAIVDDTVLLVHDDEAGDMAYLTLVAAAIKDRDLLAASPRAVVVLASGEPSGPGTLVVLSGDDQRLKEITTKLTAHLPGTKGGGARGRWTGKTPSLAGIDQFALKI